MLTKFLLLLLFLLAPTTVFGVNYKGIALENPPLIIANSTNVTTGILISILDLVAVRLGFTYTLQIGSMDQKNEYTSNLNDQTIDFVIGFPLLADSSDNKIGSSNIAILQRDNLLIFRANLLQKLVSNVLRECFFIFFIILLPWAIINSMIFYAIEIRRFYKLDFLQGVWISFQYMVSRNKKTSTCGRVYSLIFILATILLSMFLLGDFIYVIAAMLLKSDSENINEYIYNESSICSLRSDFLVSEFFTNVQDISAEKVNELAVCFSGLGDFRYGSIFVSEAILKRFLKENINYNNKFDFISRDNVYVDYAILSNNPGLYGIQSELDQMNEIIIPDLIKKYYQDPTFDKILPTSIFSDSILLIFMSLTITSIIVIIFLIILLNKLRKKPNSHHRLRLTVREGEKKGNHQKSMSDYGKRLYSNDLEGQRRMEPDPYDQGKPKGYNKNKTLSLDGPVNIKRFDGKPDIWMKVDNTSSKGEGSFKFHGTSSFENQISSVEKAEESYRSNQNVFEIETQHEEGEGRHQIRKTRQRSMSNLPKQD